MAEAAMMIAAYEDRVNDQWRQTRQIGYLIYCSATEEKGRPSMYKWLPLPGDPTAEEIAAMKKGGSKTKKLKSLADRVTADILKKLEYKKGKL